MGCQSGYKFPADGLGFPDFDDVFVRKEYFSEGGLWVWGLGTQGQLGDNTTISKSSPVQTISGGVNWNQVSGWNQTSAAIKSDGTLWMWGTANPGGKLGNNSIVNSSSPVQTISGGTNWKQVSLGGTMAAIKTDGTLWTWGSNSTGDNSTVTRSSPVQTISGGTNWKQVAAGGRGVAAIKTDGTLWLWGDNADGLLGVNTVINQSSPVQTISGGTNWYQVSISGDSTSVSGGGQGHAAAIKTDGTLWVWGDNSSGKLGINSGTSRSSPVQTISAGTNWKQVVATEENISAIKTDGSLWLWGSGANGRLGTNSVVDRSSPVQTVSGGTNWKQHIVNTHSLSIREDCW